MIGLMITSYEVDEEGSTPTLAHIFYGKTIDECYQIARSHLSSDIFFCSSIIGEMDWKKDKIYIEYDGDIIDAHIKDKKKTLNKILKKLEKDAVLTHKRQKRFHILEQVDHLSTLS